MLVWFSSILRTIIATQRRDSNADTAIIILYEDFVSRKNKIKKIWTSASQSGRYRPQESLKRPLRVVKNKRGNLSLKKEES